MCSLARGITRASTRPLKTLMMGSSSPVITRAGCRIRCRWGRLDQQLRPPRDLAAMEPRRDRL